MTDNNQQDIAEAQRRVFDNNECSICLGQHINKSQPPCGHVFCFQCLSDWCQIKRACPTCKQPFTSFIHSIQPTNNYQVYTPNQPGDQDSDDDFEISYDSDNSLNSGDSLNDDEVELVERFEDLLNNRYNDLVTFLSSRNSPEPSNEALVREVSTILNEYGSFFRNNRTTLRQLENWRNTTPNGLVISAFFSDEDLDMMEAFRPGMRQVLNQVFSLLLTGQ